MIVQCENCGTKYNVDPGRIKDEGSRVKCSQCGGIFMLYREPEDDPYRTDPHRPSYSEPSENIPPQQPDFPVESAEEDFKFEYLDDGRENVGAGQDFELEAESGSDEVLEASFEDEETLPSLEDEFIPEELSDESTEISPDDEDAEIDISPSRPKETPESISFGENERLSFPEKDEAPLDEFKVSEIEETIDDLEDTENDFAAKEEDHDLIKTFVEERFEEETDVDIPVRGEDFETAPEPEIKPEKKKKRRGLFFWLLLVILILTAAVAGVWYFAPDLIKPLIAPLIETEKAETPDEDPLGNAKIILDDKLTRDFFKENTSAGQLLVITGLAANNYKTARSQIRLNALIHDAKENVLDRTMVYCGNILTDTELETLSIDEINGRLKQKTGDNNANMNILPGKTVEFMIVFSKVPQEVAGYTVEVANSLPAAAGQ